MTLSITKAKQRLEYTPRVDNQWSFGRYKKWYQAIRTK